MDRNHNVPGSRLAEANPQRVAAMRQQMDQPAYFLDKDRRATVLDTLQEVCVYRGWNLWAAHVRANHVHVIVEADVRPEKVVNAFKSYASRRLNRLGIDGPDRKALGATEVRGGYGKMRTCKSLLYRRGSVLHYQAWP